ncbi:hypothetical protein P12x_002691 [Tundrisphaera lichenicola]|uniref:hypothetical protein n=1 Tax=Tundrisphaera lichenicola TaxID=2029860 RepID=UPI003EB99BC4
MKWAVLFLIFAGLSTAVAAEGPPTREFEIKDDRAFLGGEPVELWGLRCGNALYSGSVTERHVNALDTMVAHGINLIGVYIQGTNGGSPNPEAGLDGFRRDGRLKADVAERLEWLIREADRRGMVVMVGVLSPRKDQDLYDEAALRRAFEETARFFETRKLRNVFVDLVHEYDHAERIDHPLLREPDGALKKAKISGWFKAIAPEIEVGVCPSESGETADEYPGMDVRIIQKSMPIPSRGFVVNVETTRHDYYENDGLFSPGDIAEMKASWQDYREAPNAVMLFHAAYLQGISNKSGTAPNPEPGGNGIEQTDRGIRFYFDWVRDNAGRWEYPRHVPVEKGAAK